jgi:hypothetical protein
MIISDLLHCQSATAEISGSRGYRSWFKSSSAITKVYQKVDAYAVAVNLGKFGDAIAYNETYQSVKISN